MVCPKLRKILVCCFIHKILAPESWCLCTVFPIFSLHSKKICLFQLRGARELTGTSCKEELICALLNNQRSVDLQLMEATKALMMLATLQLHSDYTADKPVPVFVWLMFARDTSLDPKAFFENHLNAIGDSGGLEQVCTAFSAFYFLNM